MESCFYFFTACYIPDHIPEWKQNIKVIKKKLLGPDRLLGPWLAYIAPGKCVIAAFSESISVHRFPFSSVFPVPFLFTVGGKTFHESFFFPFLRHVEAVEDKKRAESGIQSFLAQVEPLFTSLISRSDAPKIQNTTGFLAHDQNALIDTCTACARKQTQRETLFKLTIQVLVRRQC